MFQVRELRYREKGRTTLKDPNGRSADITKHYFLGEHQPVRDKPTSMHVYLFKKTDGIEGYILIHFINKPTQDQVFAHGNAISKKTYVRAAPSIIVESKRSTNTIPSSLRVDINNDWSRLPHEQAVDTTAISNAQYRERLKSRLTTDEILNISILEASFLRGYVL